MATKVKSTAKKQKAKTVLVVHQVHTTEMRSGHDNRPIRSPYLKPADKYLEPIGYVDGEPEKDPDYLFEPGELSYGKRYARLKQVIIHTRIRFEELQDSEEFRVWLVGKRQQRIVRYFLIDTENGNSYTFADYDDILEQYDIIYTSKNISDIYQFIRSMAFDKR